MQGRTRLLGFGVIVASSLALSGCLPLTIAVPERTDDSDQNPASVFIAGVGKSDITPIPGVALGSYSIDGKMSRGFWTRLHARALYLRGETGTPLILVSADLGAIPGGLGDEVTRRLHETAPALTWISREHLLLAATHTHHGPGNFYTTEMYNGLVSPRPFFDDALFRFLARRIADAIVLAYQVLICLRTKAGM